MILEAELILDRDVINRNMRCIEMPFSSNQTNPSALINRNMRCIEICTLHSGYIRLP